MFLVALTGGIASGKSVVAARLAELGAVHVDADKLAREVVEPGSEALGRIRESFGAGVITADGTLDRAALGKIVFADPQKLATLNAITHPAVIALAKKRFAEASVGSIVVYDVPLLVEGGGTRLHPYAHIVTVEADPATRIERMVHNRRMDRADAERRIANQATDDDRRAIADTVIDANGTLEQTLDQVDRLWERLSAQRDVAGAS